MVLYEYYTGKNQKLEKRLSLLYQAEPSFYIDMPDGEAAPVFDYKTFPFEIFEAAPLRNSCAPCILGNLHCTDLPV